MFDGATQEIKGVWFLRVEASYYFLRVLVIAILSVCPSVRPSICLSHGWISQKRCKL